MWTSSTATPAAIGGSASGDDERKASAGRSRLPPAASAPRADLGDEARVARDRARAELVLDVGEVLVEARCGANDLERGHAGHRAWPGSRVKRDDAAAEQPVAHVLEPGALA